MSDINNGSEPRDLLDALADDIGRRIGRTIDADALAHAIGEVARESLAMDSVAEGWAEGTGRAELIISDAEAVEIARDWSDGSYVAQCFIVGGEIWGYHPKSLHSSRSAFLDPSLLSSDRLPDDLRSLLAYFDYHGERSPVDGWGDDWADGGTVGYEDTRPSGFFA